MSHFAYVDGTKVVVASPVGRLAATFSIDPDPQWRESELRHHGWEMISGWGEAPFNGKNVPFCSVRYTTAA